MAIIKQQENYNFTANIGPTDRESVNQSLFFERDFTLDSVIVKFDSTNADVERDVKFRCEVRKAVGPDNLLDISRTVHDVSPWYNDEDIPPTEFTFVLNSLELVSGTYFFSIVSNLRVAIATLLSIQRGGTFLGKFIKIEFGSGTYKTDRSLMIKINGSWAETAGTMDEYDLGLFYQTTLRDET